MASHDRLPTNQPTDVLTNVLTDVPTNMPTLDAAVVHGGDLWRAMQQYGGLPADWLDLSTGINAHAYPVPTLPEDIWRCLPNDHDGLIEIARRYYDVPQALGILAIPGSQYAIRQVPSLLPPGTVGIAELSYGEYAPAFRRHGHSVVRYRYPRQNIERVSEPEDGLFTLHPDQPLPDDLRYLVVVNPNNPTTHRYSSATLLQWRTVLQARGGMLIVDEAFADVDPSTSVLSALGRVPGPAGLHGLLVLRSVGKFFGLAGIRAGFVMSAPPLLQRLADHMGAWAVSGPARHALRYALADQEWQAATRTRLLAQSVEMAARLRSHGLPVSVTPLFIWFPHAQAAALQHRLAEQLIWTRLFDPCDASNHQGSLRLGIPPDRNGLDHLDKALADALATKCYGLP